MNIALGGDAYQDLKTQYNDGDLICHSQSAPKWAPYHHVSIKEESRLHQILGTYQIDTNSFHHQAVRNLAYGLEPVAWAADGVIEAIESESHPFLIGVQWHPERMLEDPRMMRLFEAFVEAAASYKS